MFTKFLWKKGMIQVIWGQKICVFSKRINKRNIYDKKLDLYERCCTFDGADHYSENGYYLKTIIFH